MEQGIRDFDEKVKKSRLKITHPGFQPLYQKAGWWKDVKAREKAMKRSTWFRGDNKKGGGWKDLAKTDRKMRKKGFPKAGKLNKAKRAAATVIFVPSTKGSMQIKSLKEEEEKMAELTGFKVKFQKAGGSKLVNCFDKDLG